MQHQTIPSFKIRNIKGQAATVTHPDPVLAAERLSLNIVERFYTKIEQTEDCWVWKGATNEHGDGRIGRAGRRTGHIGAMKLSWLLHNGAIQPKVNLQSACPHSNTFCVHPNHIRYSRHSGLSDLKPPYTHKPITPEQEYRIKTLCSLAGIALAEVLENAKSKHQTPQWMIGQGFSDTFADRFWSKVNKTETCWLWTGSINDSGYGMLGKGSSKFHTVASHRASWMLHHGAIPDGLWALHDCPGKDNPGCVNPDHLWLGTTQENHKDAVDKFKAEHGVHWNSKMNAERVQEIRDARKSGLSFGAISIKFGISRSHASRISAGLSHSDPTPECDQNNT